MLCSMVRAYFPKIDHGALAVFVKELDTGITLLKYNEHIEFDPASLLKLVVFLVVIKMTSKEERQNILVKISKNVINSLSYNSTSMHLREGQKVSLEMLLNGMVVASANDAAYAIAEYLGGSEKDFMHNQAAPLLKQIGLKNIYFDNASGLHESGKISANDLMLLMSYIVDNHLDEYLEYFSKQEIVFNNRTYSTRQVRLNCGNGKTGYLETVGYNFITLQEMSIGKVVIIGIGWKSMQERENKVQSIIDWIKRQYGRYLLTKNSNKKPDIIQVRNGFVNKIELIPEEAKSIILPKYSYGSFNVQSTYPSYIYAPVKKGQVIGSVKIEIDNGDILKYDLVSPINIDKIEGIASIMHFIKNDLFN